MVHYAIYLLTIIVNIWVLAWPNYYIVLVINLIGNDVANKKMKPVVFWVMSLIDNFSVISIYPIICLKSVCLSGDVRTMQFVILAQLPREMSQTDRIHPRYFLLRVRVSIRPRYFVNAKKPCCLLRSAPLRPDEQLNSKPQNRANWLA